MCNLFLIYTVPIDALEFLPELHCLILKFIIKHQCFSKSLKKHF